MSVIDKFIIIVDHIVWSSILSILRYLLSIWENLVAPSTESQEEIMQILLERIQQGTCGIGIQCPDGFVCIVCIQQAGGVEVG